MSTGWAYGMQPACISHKLPAQRLPFAKGAATVVNQPHLQLGLHGAVLPLCLQQGIPHTAAALHSIILLSCELQPREDRGVTLKSAKCGWK